MTHLGVVEDRDAESILLLVVVELDVGVAVGDRFRAVSIVQTPSFQLDFAEMSPRSPVKGATMIPGISSPGLYFTVVSFRRPAYIV